jgi:hypothetical protein
LRTKRLPYNKAHMKAIVSWCNILIDKLTLINDRNRLFQLFSNLESKKTKTRLISNIVLSVYVGILRANNICHCVHTYTSIYLCVYIYIYIYIGLASSNVSRRIRLEPVHTHTTCFFFNQTQVSGCHARQMDNRNEKASLMRMELFSFMQYFIVASSILSRNDSRLIKLVQCVNLIRRFPSYSISFYTLTHTHFIHCASISSCVCFITSTDSIDLLNLARKKRVRLNRS